MNPLRAITNHPQPRAALAGLCLALSLALMPTPQALADDIDIYTQPPPTSSALPLVVLVLDLNLDPTQIVCSNMLAGDIALVEPVCGLLQEVIAVPVLSQLTDLAIGTLLDTLAGVGSLLSLVGDLVGTTLGDLAGALRGVTGDTGSGSVVPLDQLDVVRLLLYRVLHQLVGVRVAVMANNASTCLPEQFTVPRHNTHNCSNGAFFVLGATELLDNNLDTTVNDVLTRLGNLDVSTLDPGVDVTPPYQGKEVYYELVRYLTDGRIYNAGIDDDNGLPALGDPDVAPGNNGVDYISPLDSGTCQTITVVNIMLTDSQQDDESDADILADPIFAGANANGDAFTWTEMRKHLATEGFDHNGGHYRINSQFLVNGPQGQLLSNLVGSVMSLPLGINPLAVQLLDADTFLPTLPVSASLGGPQPVVSPSSAGAENDLYIGLFQPDPERSAAWRGNLKKLALGSHSGATTVLDALGAPAIGPNGDIADTALTYWTDPTALPAGANGRDGGVVDQGGAGMFLLAPSPANDTGADLYYQTAGSGLTIAPLNLDTATVDEAEPALETADRLEAAKLIAWARGYVTSEAVLGEDGYDGLLGFLSGLVGGLVDLIEGLLEGVLGFLFCLLNPSQCNVPDAVVPPAQPWLMGDVLHSHPLAIDYGDSIRIFVGTNLGFLHQFSEAESSGDNITEVWRFAPRAVMDEFKNWASDSQVASHPYGVDGAPVAWVEDGGDGVVDASEGDHVTVYFGLRRGGRAYYALDVTNPDAAPTGRWQIDAATPGFAELGRSFSVPRIARVQLDDDDDGTTPPVIHTVLVFAGGYDPDYDEGAVPGSGVVGNAIFVVDAQTGDLIWKASEGTTGTAITNGGVTIWQHPAFDDPIASTVTTLDTDGDGFLDRVYVGDIGGRLWRADVANLDTANWKAAPIASLGRHAGSAHGAADDRRFFHRPDVVRAGRGGDAFYAVVIGSGDRADPLDQGTENALFVIKDSGTLDVQTSPITGSDLADFGANCSGGDCDSLLDPGFSQSGWRITLGGADPDRAGEKVLASPTTIAGTTLVTSYIPPTGSNSCRPSVGSGRLYAVNLLTAEPALPAFEVDGEPGGYSAGVHYGRGTPLDSGGIPAGVTYVAPQEFLASDYSITQVMHRLLWRTYWRDRSGDN